MKRHAFLIFAVVGFFLSLASVDAHQIHPAFTIVEQTTYYDAKGEAVDVINSTLYYSASGDWRSIGTFAGGESGTVYWVGKGVYRSDSRSGRLIKVSDHAPGCPLTTAEELLHDSKFTRTEIVLGLKAYVLSERFDVGYRVETFFVPELGRTPFKRVYFLDDGQTWVTEPTGITFGEPAAADLNGPDYPVVEQAPIYIQDLSKQVISKPAPIYPPAVRARGIGGTVWVQVMVDQSGRVISASISSPIPVLHEEVLDAAYQASFSPTIRDGKAVVASGSISYEFVPPRVTKE